MKRTLILAAVTLTALVASPAQGAAPTSSPTASSRHPLTAEEALARQMRREPGGKLVKNQIHYSDQRVFVAVDAGTYSLSQCTAGRFCIWNNTSYTGSFIYKSGQDVTRSIETSVGSFYNNRARAARLYSNTGASSICYDAQEKKASVSASYNAAEKVYLSGTTGC
jgi:hypothetical protein